MNCDRAGDLLGAYLRDELMPSTRAEVQEHLNHCASCRADLDLDRLVFELPRVEPSAALHDRIFSSPEFQEIARAVSLYNQPGVAHSNGRSSGNGDAPVGDSISANGNFPHLTILRTSSPLARERTNGHQRPVVTAQRKSQRIDWQRMAIRMAVAAAVLVLVLGSALAAKNALQKQPTAATIPTYDPAGPVPGPLAAGNRAVYFHDGRLWSAPENGPQIRSPLTDTSVTVAPGWAVAPAVGPNGTHHLAYIDLKTGTLHIIQTDDRNDQAVGSVAPKGTNLAAFWQSAEGQAVLAGLVWAPDARQLAFIADRDGAGATVWVVNADGSAARSISGPASADVLPSLPAWAPDGSNLAYVLTGKGGASIWDVAFDGSPAQMLESQASPEGAANDVVGGLFWTSDTLNPMITWSAKQAGGNLIDGLWSYRLSETPHLARLTPNGALFSAVDYSQQAGDVGSWLVGQVGIGLRSVHADGSAVNGLAPGHVAAVQWSPDGSSALYIVAEAGSMTGALWTWTPLLGQRQIATNVALAPAPAWSPDGQYVLYVANGHSWVAGAAGNSQPLSGAGAATALSWSPDGLRVALASARGVTISNPDGGKPDQVDNVGSVDAVIWTAVP
ncbi:MAG TPA: zf-HC2 domain-containing protein [Ktedonobacterales bacterium]|nr:zf-HC2 domain-containing protein [Ktedonobacterales bacterium]